MSRAITNRTQICVTSQDSLNSAAILGKHTVEHGKSIPQFAQNLTFNVNNIGINNRHVDVPSSFADIKTSISQSNMPNTSLDEEVVNLLKDTIEDSKREIKSGRQSEIRQEVIVDVINFTKVIITAKKSKDGRATEITISDPQNPKITETWVYGKGKDFEKHVNIFFAKKQPLTTNLGTNRVLDTFDMSNESSVGRQSINESVDTEHTPLNFPNVQPTETARAESFQKPNRSIKDRLADLDLRLEDSLFSDAQPSRSEKKQIGEMIKSVRKKCSNLDNEEKELVTLFCKGQLQALANKLDLSKMQAKDYVRGNKKNNPDGFLAFQILNLCKKVGVPTREVFSTFV